MLMLYTAPAAPGWSSRLILATSVVPAPSTASCDVDDVMNNWFVRKLPLPGVGNTEKLAGGNGSYVMLTSLIVLFGTSGTKSNVASRLLRLNGASATGT